MSGGWADSDRKSRLPDNWGALRAAALKRDGYRCTWWLPKSKQRCPRRATDVDHKIPNDDDSLRNLQSLCSFHHGKKSAREGWQAKQKVRQSRYRPPEAHPGMRS